MPPRTTTASPPPPLYDTSISTHEETSWHSSSYQSRGGDSGGGGGGGAQTAAPAHRGWFPKSHPKSPRYDPRAFRRDEYHRPVHSEPIVLPRESTRHNDHPSFPSRFPRKSHQEQGYYTYPDPEPNLLSLESTHDDDDNDDPIGVGNGAARRLPVFTIDGIASEVALGSRRTTSSPSRALTRDLLSRLDARRNHKNQQKNHQQQLSDPQRVFHGGGNNSSSSRRDAPPPSLTGGAAAAVDIPTRRVQAVSRRSGNGEDVPKGSVREAPGWQTPPPPPDRDPRSGSADWQRRVEIETPEPARVTELKQRLWDDRESLHNKSPVVHRHVDLQYDRQGLNQRWKQWHGEGDNGGEPEGSTPARVSVKPLASATTAATSADSNRRSRSLSPGTAASARSRTPPPPMLPLTPGSGYSTPKPHQMFQSRFVQAAHRASPAAPHHSFHPSTTTATATKPVVPAASMVPSGSRRNESAFVLSSPVSAKGDADRASAEKPQAMTPMSTPVAPTGLAGHASAPAARPAEELSSSVADLVARLQKVRRENPDQALAEIDTIIQQSQGQAATTTLREGAAVQPTEVPAAAARLVLKPVDEAVKGVPGARGDGNDANIFATSETPRRARHESNKNQQNNDPTEQEGFEDAHDGSDDDDETSVSSITNPTYGVVGSEYHHPRPTVLSTFKGAGQPRPSALSNYNGRSSLRTTELQQPAYGRSRRQARHRSPPPASIHVTREASNAEQSYQQLHDDEESELDAVLGTAHRTAIGKAAEQSELTATEQVTLKHSAIATVPRSQQPLHLGWVTEPRSLPARADALPVSTEAPVANAEDMVALAKEHTDLALDPSNSADLAQKIKKWDEMSEPDFCPAVGCLNSKSSDHDLHRSPPLMVDSLVEMVCPREEDVSAMKRRHHPWDRSIPVCMGQVSVHETSMDHAAGVEAEYSMKYQDARSEMSVSVEASASGGVQREKKTRKVALESLTETKGGMLSKAVSVGQQREVTDVRGDAFDINPKLVSPDSVGDIGPGLSSEHQAYARDLADDFDSAWVSLPSSAFFRDGQQEVLRSSSTDSDKLASQAKVLSVSKPGESSSPRRPHQDQYQTFRAREGERKNESSKVGVSGDATTTKTFELAGNRQGENGGFEVAILNDMQQKSDTSVPASYDASRSRRGLRKFLKLRQGGRTSSMSQGSVSTSSRSHLQSVSLDLQSASLDMDAAEVPPPPSRGRSQLDATGQTPDRLRSRSLDERRIRNPHIAKKFSRLLRVYEENPSKQFGII